MTPNNEKRQAFVEAIAAQNRKFYDTPDGRGALNAFELTFENRWIYLFELVQNALDAGATSISIDIQDSGEVLTFEHNGSETFREKDVESLSKVFRSTKGASSVGFMGVGFKSVFGRFCEAKVSDRCWQFRYELRKFVGDVYGDVQLDLIGAVLPIWDNSIPPPTDGFTTRFELCCLRDPTSDLGEDIKRFLPATERTPLAILAAAGLQQLTVCGESWELGLTEGADGSVEATALSANQNHLWQLFSVNFAPSRSAIARFLEHRRIQPTTAEQGKVYAEAGRARKILGVLPLDDSGFADPPAQGNVYATLPTEVELPFGVHVNGDWLLNISRTGLREIEENLWQREIVYHVADIIAALLRWIAQTCPTADAARAAFQAINPGLESAGPFKSLIVQDVWLDHLRDLIADLEVIPVIGTQTGQIRYTNARNVLVPPESLSKIFEEHPEMDAATLLQGEVVARDVIGELALDLFVRIGLLTPMSPHDLAFRWSAGLEYWWQALPDHENSRRDTLFRLWGALADLASEDDWDEKPLLCVRSVAGTWIDARKASFFTEMLPTDREPGGRAARQLIQSFLPNPENLINDRWVAALRQAAAQEKRSGPFTAARGWIEERAGKVDLRDGILLGVDSLVTSNSPDWSVLVSLAHWIRHRANRTDLLTHVLVEKGTGLACVSTEQALLADPYVERGESRRRLFPDSNVVSAVYLERDQSGADGHDWRTFFDSAGVCGTLKVKEVSIRKDQWARTEVAEFLGLPPDRVPDANYAGYRLIDFEISPPLPHKDSADSVRNALAPWLEDGYSALLGKGLRKANYHYFTPYVLAGTLSSKWVVELSALAWVPCNDRVLREPCHVLSRVDPSREDAPVAQLSEDLITTLEREGVVFGSGIPEAPALRRLLKLGSRLSAADLAELLKEVREQVTPLDVASYARAIRQLAIPILSGQRVPIARLAGRVGGRLRGGLAGWVMPLSGLDEQLRDEITNPAVPYDIPDTTTGAQALDYLRHVWSRAQLAPEGLANEVRDVLPAAYTYLLADCEDNEVLATRWAAERDLALVFAEREWVKPGNDNDVYFDDFPDRRFFPAGTVPLTATGGHLGNTAEQQARTAEALGLIPLSSIVRLAWTEIGRTSLGEWAERFDRINDLLQQVRTGEQTERTQSFGQLIALRRVHELHLMVRVGTGAAVRVFVDARMHAATLIVAGRPSQFAADASKELLRSFSFGQRGELAADLTGLLASIDDPADFSMAIEKFFRSHIPGYVAEATPTHQPDDDSSDGGEQPSVETEEADGNDDSSRSQTSPGTDASFTRDRALARQKALAEQLRIALKGELDLSDEDANINSSDDSSEGQDTRGGLGDEIYRQAVIQYERANGRVPELGAPHQEGWDLISTDTNTGKKRLIEVKGKGCSWTDDEVIELSRAQVRIGFWALSDDELSSWYLYVVEKLSEREFLVLPIENPVRLANKWVLRGSTWRMVASEPQIATVSPLGEPAHQEDTVS